MTDILKECFPHETFNPGQKEAIIKAIAAIKRGVKHVIIEAPTGVGKSAIAVAINNFLLKLDNYHRTSLITCNKGLQDQYVNEYGTMYDLKGKQNYSCPHNTYYNSAECKSHISAGRCSSNVCEYVTRRDYWLNRAQFRLTNSTFIVKAPPSMIATDTTKSTLMIIDECHELANTIIDNASLYISSASLSQTAKTYGSAFDKSFKDVLKAIGSIGVGNAFSPNKINMVPIETFYHKLESIVEAIETALQSGQEVSQDRIIVYEELSSMLYTMSVFINMPDAEWILTEFENDEKRQIIKIKPVYAHQVSKTMFYKADQFIHMSATICGFKEYCYNLGINANEAVFIEVNNPIPLENRPVFIDTEISLNKNTSPRDVAKKVDDIIKDKDINSNGIIHTVSFKLANDIKDNSRYSHRMVVSNNREEILELLNMQKGYIILSPSVETGYDFKGDIARWQIIAKVPFGFIGDPYIKLNMTRDPKWYSRQALLRLVQASGRVVRGMTDYGETYIIDGNVVNLLQRCGDMVPGWYLDALDIF